MRRASFDRPSNTKRTTGSNSSVYNYTASSNSRNVEIKRLKFQSSGQTNNPLQRSFSADNVVIRSRGFKPSDRHDPTKRHFLENLSSKILHFDMDSGERSRPIDLQKLLTPAMDTMDTMDTSEFMQSNMRKKMYASSCFYAPTHPTVEDQVELARRISYSLSDVKNMKSKGQSMYVNRKKRSVKWIHDGNGEEDEEEPQSPIHKDKVPLKCMMNPNGKVLDLKCIQALGEDPNIGTSPINAEKLFDIVRDLNCQKGRGAEIFAKRRKRSEKWVVDKEPSSTPVTPSGLSKTPTYPNKMDFGANENAKFNSQSPMSPMPVQNETKPFFNPFTMDLSLGSAPTQSGNEFHRSKESLENFPKKSESDLKKMYLKEAALANEQNYSMNGHQNGQRNEYQNGHQNGGQVPVEKSRRMSVDSDNYQQFQHNGNRRTKQSSSSNHSKSEQVSRGNSSNSHCQMGNGYSQMGNGQSQISNGQSHSGNGYSQNGNGNPQMGNGQFRTGHGNPQMGNGYSQMGNGNPQMGNGYPQMGNGDPQIGNGYSQMGNGNSQMGNGNSQMGNGYSQMGNGYSQMGNGNPQMRNRNSQMGNGNLQIGNGYSQMGNGNTHMGNGNHQMGNGNPQMGNGNPQMGNGYSQMGNGNLQMGNGYSQIGNGYPQMGNGYSQVDNGYSQVENGQPQIRNGRPQMGNGHTQMENNRSQIGNGYSQVGNGPPQMGNSRPQIGNGRPQKGNEHSSQPEPINEEGIDYTPVPVKQLIQEFEKTCRPLLQYKQLSPRVVPVVQHPPLDDISRFFTVPKTQTKFEDPRITPKQQFSNNNSRMSYNSNNNHFDDKMMMNSNGNGNRMNGNNGNDAYERIYQGAMVPRYEYESTDDEIGDSFGESSSSENCQDYYSGPSPGFSNGNRISSMSDYDYRRQLLDSAAGQLFEAPPGFRNGDQEKSVDKEADLSSQNKPIAILPSQEDIIKQIKQLRRTSLVDSLVSVPSPDSSKLGDFCQELGNKLLESSYNGPKISSFQTLTNYNTAPRGWDQSQSFYRPVTFGKPQEPIAYSDF